MEIPHHVVIDQEGVPQSVIISWETFQEIQDYLADKAQEDETRRHKLAEHIEGGDYKSLAALGLKLPSTKKKKHFGEESAERKEDVNFDEGKQRLIRGELQ